MGATVHYEALQHRLGHRQISYAAHLLDVKDAFLSPDHARAEAEFYSMVSATSGALGLKAMFGDYRATLDP